MTFDWGSFWIGFITAPAAVGVGAVLLALVLRALDKNVGSDGCLVCDQALTYEIGEYTRIGIWFRSRRHSWFVRPRKWHREAWARNRWNPFRLPGYPEDNGSARPRRRKPNIFVRATWAIFG